MSLRLDWLLTAALAAGLLAGCGGKDSQHFCPDAAYPKHCTAGSPDQAGVCCPAGTVIYNPAANACLSSSYGYSGTYWGCW